MANLIYRKCAGEVIIDSFLGLSDFPLVVLKSIIFDSFLEANNKSQQKISLKITNIKTNYLFRQQWPKLICTLIEQKDGSK